jgi:hypothetical protein
MNIQDKIIRHNRKQQKTTETKRAELSGPEAQRVEYEQTTKSRLSEQERNLVDKYFQKLSPLRFGEYDVYQLVKKYEWNEKALDEVSNEKLRYKEESSQGDGWTEIKRTEKSQPAPNDRNPKEGQKQRRIQKNFDQPADNNEQKPYNKNRQQDRRRDNEQRQNNKESYHEYDQEYQDNRNYNQNRRADREYYQPKRNNQNRRNNYNQEPREEPRGENQQNQEPKTEENVNERKESYNQQDNKRAGGRRNNHNQNQKYNKASNSPIYGKRGGYEQFEYVRKEVPTPTAEKKPEESQQQQVSAPVSQTEQTKASVPQERKVNPKINEPQPTPIDSRVTETKHKEEKKEPVAHPTKQTPVKAHKEQHQPTHQTSSKKQEKHEAPVQTHPVNQQANTSPLPQQPVFNAPTVLPSMPSGPQFLLPQTVDAKPLFPYPYTVFPLPNGSCHIVPFYLMMPPMMFPPQFQGVPQPQPQHAGPQGNPSHQEISQHQMSSFFSFPENGPKKN